MTDEQLLATGIEVLEVLWVANFLSHLFSNSDLGVPHDISEVD